MLRDVSFDQPSLKDIAYTYSKLLFDSKLGHRV